MLVIPEEIKTLFRADNTTAATHKKFKLTFYDDYIETLYPYETLFPDESLFPAEHGTPWLIIENDKIVSESLQITEALSSDENMVFGSCEGAEMQITVADINQDITGREFTLTVEIGGYEMALGIYTVQSFVRQSDRRKRKITAYDRMNWFNVDVSDWYNNLPFPMTLKTFRDSLCGYIGIQQTQVNLLFDSLQIAKTIEPQQISGLDVLKAICEINGCFGHVDKTGALTYVQLQQTGLYPSEMLYPEETLYPSEFGGDGMPTEVISTYKQPMTYEDYLVDGIESLIIRQEEGDVGASAGTGNNTYVIEGNFLVYGKSAVDLLNIANTLLPYISGRVYKPAVVDCNYMPWVEVGDAIIVPTKDDIVETFVMKRTITGCQAMRDKFEATGSKTIEEQFTLSKQIIQLEGKAAIITKSVEEVSVRVTDLKKYTEAQFKITADAITAEVTRAQEAEAQLSIQADQISASVTDLRNDTESQFVITANQISAEVTARQNGDNQLSSRITQTAESIELKVSKGDVSSQLSIETDGINITGNRLTWSATNSSMSADGTLTCNNIKATNGTFSGNISGSNISGSTIEIGPLSVNNDWIYIGDFNTSTDGSNNFSSNDGSFYIHTAQTPGASSAELFVGSSKGYGTTIQGPNIFVPGEISCGIVNATDTAYSHFYDIELEKSWWNGWTITETVQDLWDQVQDLSDETVKENIVQIDPEEALSFLLASNPITFQYKTDGRWSSGFIAQEVDAKQDELEIYYPLVGTDRRSGKYKIDYKNYIPLIVSALQNFQNQIDLLKSEIGESNENTDI